MQYCAQQCSAVRCSALHASAVHYIAELCIAVQLLEVKDSLDDKRLEQLHEWGDTARIKCIQTNRITDWNKLIFNMQLNNILPF